MRYVNHRTDNGPTRAQSESVNPKPPDRPLQVEKAEAADLSASAGDGVKWAGEHDAMARRRNGTPTRERRVPFAISGARIHSAPVPSDRSPRDVGRGDTAKVYSSRRPASGRGAISR
jgi:hypothetical protein